MAFPSLQASSEEQIRPRNCVLRLIVSCQAESSQESSQCTARGEIPAEITGLTKLYGTGFGTAGAMLKMCGTFRIQSQVLEEDLCRPLHLPRVSCPRRQGVRRVGGSHARLPSFTVRLRGCCGSERLGAALRRGESGRIL